MPIDSIDMVLASGFAIVCSMCVLTFFPGRRKSEPSLVVSTPNSSPTIRLKANVGVSNTPARQAA